MPPTDIKRRLIKSSFKTPLIWANLKWIIEMKLLKNNNQKEIKKTKKQQNKKNHMKNKRKQEILFSLVSGHHLNPI